MARWIVNGQVTKALSTLEKVYGAGQEVPDWVLALKHPAGGSLLEHYKTNGLIIKMGDAPPEVKVADTASIEVSSPEVVEPVVEVEVPVAEVETPAAEVEEPSGSKNKRSGRP